MASAHSFRWLIVCVRRLALRLAFVRTSAKPIAVARTAHRIAASMRVTPRLLMGHQPFAKRDETKEDRPGMSPDEGCDEKCKGGGATRKSRASAEHERHGEKPGIEEPTSPHGA